MKGQPPLVIQNNTLATWRRQSDSGVFPLEIAVSTEKTLTLFNYNTEARYTAVYETTVAAGGDGESEAASFEVEIVVGKHREVTLAVRLLQGVFRVQPKEKCSIEECNKILISNSA